MNELPFSSGKGKEKRSLNTSVPKLKLKPKEDIGTLLEEEVTKLESSSERETPLDAENFDSSSKYSKIDKSMYEYQKRVINTLYTEVVRRNEGLEEALRQIDTVETLMSGKEISREVVGGDDPENSDESGVNVTTKRVFEGGVVGFAKSPKGEAVFGKGGYMYKWNEKEKKYISMQGQDVEDIDRGIRQMNSEKYDNAFFKSLQEEYGLNDNELAQVRDKIFGEFRSTRVGIAPKESVTREMVVPQLGKLRRFKSFPQTIFRKENDEYVSIQEGAISKNRDEKMEPPNAKDLEVMLKVPYAQWKDHFGEEAAKKLAEAVVEGAMAAEEGGFLDQHPDNMLWNRNTGEVAWIDNSLSFPWLRGKKVEGESVNTRAFRSIRSIAYEILRANPELTASDKQRADADALYKAIISGGPEKQIIEDAFKTLFPVVKVAQKQLLTYLEKLRYHAKHGRPPEKQALDHNWKNSDQETYFAISDIILVKKQEKEKEREGQKAA